MTWTRRWRSRWWRRIRLCSSSCRSPKYCESVAVRRSLGVLTVCAALGTRGPCPQPRQAGGPSRGQHAAARLVRPQDQQRVRTASRGGHATARDVRRQSGALPGHRPDARRLPPCALSGAGRESGHRGRTGGGHPALSAGRRPARHSAQSTFPGPPSGGRAAQPVAAGRRARVAPSQGTQYADEDLLLPGFRHRRARHAASDPHSGARRPVGLPGRSRAGAVRRGARGTAQRPGASAAAGESRETVRAGDHPGGRAPEAGIVLSAMEAKAAEARA